MKYCVDLVIEFNLCGEISENLCITYLLHKYDELLQYLR